MHFVIANTIKSFHVDKSEKGPGDKRSETIEREAKVGITRTPFRVQAKIIIAVRSSPTIQYSFMLYAIFPMHVHFPICQHSKLQLSVSSKLRVGGKNAVWKIYDAIAFSLSFRHTRRLCFVIKRRRFLCWSNTKRDYHLRYVLAFSVFLQRWFEKWNEKKNLSLPNDLMHFHLRE